MEDRTRLNLFENYRNLEDNTTHGFLNVLKFLRSKTSQKIIEKITEEELIPDNIFYEIQNPSSKVEREIRNSDKGLVLGISSISSKEVEDKSDQKRSRPDGWITDGQTTILIESKLGSNFSKSQLKKHLEMLKKYSLKVGENAYTCWQDIDFILRKILEENNNISLAEEKIIEEFRGYLQMNEICLDFEKFYNKEKFGEDELHSHWQPKEARKTLRLSKRRLLKQIRSKTEEKKIELKEDSEIKHTKMNFYWSRIFEEKDNSKIEWRGTIYLNPDGVSADILAWRPLQRDMEEIFRVMRDIYDNLNKEDRWRSYVSIDDYGKRRSNAQKGKDYDYFKIIYNLKNIEDKQGSNSFFEELEEKAKRLNRGARGVKQVRFRYEIANPKGKYWSSSKEGESINHKDAEILKDPKKAIGKLNKALEMALKRIEI